MPEIFNYWLQPGRIDVGFLGAAQLDRFGNINTTVIGPDYRRPKVRLPGAGGAPEIAASCGEVIVVVRQSPRTFVDRVDFVTSVGLRRRPGRPGTAGPARPWAGAGHHRSRRARARPGDLRADPDPAAPGRRRRARCARRPAGTLAVAATAGARPSRRRAESSTRCATLIDAEQRPEGDGTDGGRRCHRRRPTASTRRWLRRRTARPCCARRRSRRSASRTPLTEVTGPVLGEGATRRARRRPDPPARRRAARRAHRRARPGARRATAGRCRDTLVEVWQANAAGRYVHDVDRHPAPLDPNFSGAGRVPDRRRGPLPVRHRSSPARTRGRTTTTPGGRRTSTSRCSAGRSSQRLVTQMYFPGDPLFGQDPIFNSVPDAAARERLIAAFDLDATEPEWALGYRFDIVLRGRDADPVRGRGGRRVTPTARADAVADGGAVLRRRAAVARRAVRGRRAGTPGAIWCAAGSSTAPASRCPTRSSRPGRPTRRPDRAASARLRRTDADGRYAILTVKPGQCPGPDGPSRRRTSTCRSSPAGCSTGWSPGSTSRTRRRRTRPTRCSPRRRPGRARAR